MTSHEEIRFTVNSSSAPTSDSQKFSEIKTGETATFNIKKSDISIVKIDIKVNSGDIINRKIMEPVPDIIAMISLIGNITPLTADSNSTDELLVKSPIPTVS